MSADMQWNDQTVRPFIDGGFRDSESQDTTDVISPWNGQRYLKIPTGCEADVNRAVAAARRAFEDGRWSETAPSFRKKTLHQLANLIEAHAAQLDALDAGEMGKPVSVQEGNAKDAAGHMRFYAEAIDKVRGDVLTSDKASLVIQRRVPRGVVAAVVPWNFPTIVAVQKMAPALAAGNCVVLKPSELSSRSALRIAHLAIEAGLPAGVLNVIPGIGETVGRALGLHADVDVITFTGSTEVGKLMQQYAGQSNMKVVMTECGGKSPQIVFDDGVDLDAASQFIAQQLLMNQGQLCSLGSRLLVQRSIEAAMVEKVAAHTQGIVMGNPLDPKTTFGPLVSAQQCSRVMRYIELGRKEGGQLVTGGRRVLEETGGYYVEPTVFRGVSPKASIAQEEIFGPVLAVTAFDDVEEAIRLANGTTYGLAAYAWTANLSTAMRLSKGVRSTIMINAVSPSGEGAGYAAAYEPYRQSGIGVEGGLAGLEGFLRRQLVCFNHA